MADPENADWKSESLTLFQSAVEHYALEREQMPYFQAHLRLMLEMIGQKLGRVLSIGCAAGGEFAPLLERGCSITGIHRTDIAEPAFPPGVEAVDTTSKSVVTQNSVGFHVAPNKTNASPRSFVSGLAYHSAHQ